MNHITQSIDALTAALELLDGVRLSSHPANPTPDDVRAVYAQIEKARDALYVVDEEQQESSKP